MFPILTRGLEVFDRLVAYTEFGKKELLKCKPNLLKRVSIIPHGTNLTDFYPVDDREEVKKFRKQYFKENAEKFIIGNINRNQPRKDIPASIFGFMIFKEKHPYSLLYLHMNPKDPLGHDLPAVLSQTPLKEGIDYMFPPADVNNHATSVSDLNMIYNSLDCYLTTNRGEGWGLSLSESMRCKVPVVAPLHTSIEEISQNGRNIWPLTEFDFDCSTVDNIIRYKCLDFDVAEQLEDVFNSTTGKKNGKIEAAYKYISDITWKKSAEKFIDIFNELM